MFVLRFVLTWPCLFGLYLLLSGDTSASELICGAVLTSAACLLVVRLGTIAERRFAWPRGAAGVAARSIGGVVPETARVAAVLLRAVWRQPGGEIGAAQDAGFPRAFDAEHDAARRALETIGQSLSPNGFAVAVDDRSLRLHQLAPR